MNVTTEKEQAANNSEEETRYNKIKTCLARNMDVTLNLSFMTTIIMPHAEITGIHEEFLSSLPNLIILNISCNKLEYLPKTIGCLTKLSYLNLSDNRLCSLDDNCLMLKRLRFLILSKNKFAVVPDCIYGMPILEQLDLSHNRLSEFNRRPLCYKYLQELNVSHNNMPTPMWMWYSDCPRLRILNISYTKWRPDTIIVDKNHARNSGIYDVLMTLNVSHTGITDNSVGQILRSMSNLKIVHLGNDRLEVKPNDSEKTETNSNMLHQIPNELLKVSKSLIELKIPKVGLLHVQWNMSSFECLRVLDLAENHLTDLPSSLSSLRNLKTLILSRNRLELLPINFETMISLEELYLDDNQLKQIPNSLSALKNLKYLDLYYNQLNELPFWIIDVNLQGADISGNCYTEDMDSCSDEFFEKYNKLQNALRSTNNITDRECGLTKLSYHKSSHKNNCHESKYSGSYSASDDENDDKKDYNEDDDYYDTFCGCDNVVEIANDEENWDDNEFDRYGSAREELSANQITKLSHFVDYFRELSHIPEIKPYVRNPNEVNRENYDPEDF